MLDLGVDLRRTKMTVAAHRRSPELLARKLHRILSQKPGIM
jgi:hypothetical protein